MNARRTTRSSTTRSSTTRNRRRTGTTRRRYRSRSVSSTVGTALGTLVVGALLDLSWPARIALVVLGVVLVVGYLLWRNRAEIVAGAQPPEPADSHPAEPPDPAEPPEPAAPVDPTGPPGLAEPPDPTDAPGNPTAPQDRPS